MYTHILVAIDDSDTSRSALAEAIHIARTSQARLTIVHVADETLMGMRNRTMTTTLNIEQALQGIVDAGNILLDAARQTAGDLNPATVLLEARGERISEVLVRQATESGADLIVIGRHGRRGLATLILGSVAEQVSRLATSSVLLVRKH